MPCAYRASRLSWLTIARYGRWSPIPLEQPASRASSPAARTRAKRPFVNRAPRLARWEKKDRTIQTPHRGDKPPNATVLRKRFRQGGGRDPRPTPAAADLPYPRREGLADPSGRESALSVPLCLFGLLRSRSGWGLSRLCLQTSTHPSPPDSSCLRESAPTWRNCAAKSARRIRGLETDSRAKVYFTAIRCDDPPIRRIVRG